MLKPNQIKNTGARTATGVLCRRTITGIEARSTKRECAMNVATMSAAPRASPYPDAASSSVTWAWRQ